MYDFWNTSISKYPLPFEIFYLMLIIDKNSFQPFHYSHSLLSLIQSIQKQNLYYHCNESESEKCLQVNFERIWITHKDINYYFQHSFSYNDFFQCSRKVLNSPVLIRLLLFLLMITITYFQWVTLLILFVKIVLLELYFIQFFHCETEKMTNSSLFHTMT